ncbi:hypothetical protein EOS93_31535 [Rhizobium sp. RMa-01]|uniref:hypothetical protein n=1 Tax=unclassified Rhizobium TaxID=2613769 RepID=UPI0008D9E953|nr:MULTISPECIES: hypothetical protein [unclassified Rhizobium]OHV22295.1 hypothetical protein BBJ66_30240 [Rhizobium sp. RSm-3]RVU04882.1 hypothetical protein EOS93_31535 [Rhizobium sp. RMa-01]
MRNNERFYIPILTFLTLASSVLLVISFSHVVDWKLCESDKCNVQDWLSATSGWIGFSAAVIGAYLVYHQLDQQRKQTAFLLGDGMPTIESVRSAGRINSGAILIVNWNRRALVLDSIKVFCSQPIPALSDFVFRASDEIGRATILDDNKIADHPMIHGYIDRQAAPNTLKFSVTFKSAVEIEIVKPGTTIQVTIQIKMFHPEDGFDPVVKELKIPARAFLPRPDADHNGWGA